jgi:RNA polymerase sigma factor for flagellar operon FliA
VDLVTLAERNELVLAHEGLVRQQARWAAVRVPSWWSLDDLYGYGILALFAALDRYEPGRGANLRSYLEKKVRFGILDALRQADQFRNRRLPAVRVAYEPKMHDQAVGPEQYKRALGLEAWAAVDRLRPRWQALMRMYYEQDLTMRECGEAMGVGESAASQMHWRAVVTLRRMLAA